MRRRTPSPIAPFDVVPESVVEAARRLFDLVSEGGSVTVSLPDLETREDREQTTGA